MDNRQKELSEYRVQEADNSLKASMNCLNSGLYKDSINRSYYAAFYAIKAILALGTVDFKRHKDVVAYFNKEYVATGVFPRELGKRIGVRRRITIGCNSKLNFRLTPIRPRGLACNCTFLSA